MIQPTAQQLYPAQGGGANAVSINIFNPQAYGAPQAQPQNVAPMTYPNSIYAMPQGSIYQPAMPQQFPAYMPGIQSPYIMNPAMVNPYAPQMQPVMPQQPVVPQIQPVAPMPQAMPESAIIAPQQPVAAEVQPQAPVQPAPVEPQAPVQPAPVEPQPAQQPEIVDVQQPAVPIVNTDEILQGLASTDADVKADSINKIAEYVQSTPEVALQVVSEPIMNALVNIINEDTTALEGPTDKQIEIAQKIAKGEALTDEENALAEQLSPRDKANKNRIFALYNLAMILRLQRDEMNQYIESQKANGEQPLEPLAIKDLVGYDAIKNIINNDPRPEVKVGAIEALQFIAEPQDKAEIESILADSLKADDEAVKLAAQTTIDSLNPQPQEQAKA